MVIEITKEQGAIIAFSLGTYLGSVPVKEKNNVMEQILDILQQIDKQQQKNNAR